MGYGDGLYFRCKPLIFHASVLAQFEILSCKYNDDHVTLNQRVPGSSPGAPTTQSSETHTSKPASRKAAFAAISRESWSPISGLCSEISSSGLFLARLSPAAKMPFQTRLGRLAEDPRISSAPRS